MKAALQGDDESQEPLGVFYELGIGCERSYKHAAEWYEKAAVYGNTMAQIELGDLYFKGLGVPQNYQEAPRLYTMAASEKGNPHEDASKRSQMVDDAIAARGYNRGRKRLQKPNEKCSCGSLGRSTKSAACQKTERAPQRADQSGRHKERTAKVPTN